jgi:hypothetical protein
LPDARLEVAPDAGHLVLMSMWTRALSHLAPEHERVGLLARVVETESEEAVRATLARDPWSGAHLVVETIDPWTIRLDGRPGSTST